MNALSGKMSFEQAVRFLTLDEVLEIARDNACGPVIVEDLDDRFSSSDSKTVPVSS